MMPSRSPSVAGRISTMQNASSNVIEFIVAGLVSN
jgi:hypothetical protein